MAFSPIPLIVFYSKNDDILYCYTLNGQYLSHSRLSGEFLEPLITRDDFFCNTLVNGTKDGKIIIRSLPYLDKLQRFYVVKKQRIGKLAATEDGRMLIIGYGQNADKLLIVTTNKSKET